MERRDWSALRALVERSQEEAEQALGNQVPETVHLVRSAHDVGALAASAFGAGFGGSVWALVQRSEAESFVNAWRRQYIATFPTIAPRASWFATRPAPPSVEVVLRG